MRQITSKQTKGKKQKRNQLIVGLILIVVMFFSVFGYGFLNTKEEGNKKLNYNGFEFMAQNGFWITNVNNFQFVFRYNPNQVEKIDSKLNTLKNYYQKPLYLSSENSEAEAEIYSNLNPLVQRTQRACLEGEECLDENLPIKTCEDNLIIIRENSTSGIRQEDNCVFIQGTQENLLKLSDEFLFKILEIED